MSDPVRIRFELDHPLLRLGVVEACELCCNASSPELTGLLQQAEERARNDAETFPEDVRTAVRDLLRQGGYKPTGRGKPASEFLLGAARKRELPHVNNLVDINNLVSLDTALPISIFDRDRLGDEITVRFGRAGENYCFNPSGQVMDLGGIVLVCRTSTDEPVGNAVKDSMLAKVSPTTRAALAVVYGSRHLPAGHLQKATERLGQLLGQFAEAARVKCRVLPD